MWESNNIKKTKETPINFIIFCKKALQYKLQLQWDTANRNAIQMHEYLYYHKPTLHIDPL